MVDAMRRDLQCPPTRLSLLCEYVYHGGPHTTRILRERVRRQMERAAEGALTIIANKELISAGAERAHGTTRPAPSSERLMMWIVELRNSNTLETVDNT
jgi:hypothetical protein